MLCDFHELDDNTTSEVDVCIVGSGATGIAIATEFLNSNYDVLLLEGGSTEINPESNSLYDCEIAGLKHDVKNSRARVFGGTTTLWPGQASPLLPIDFAERSWINDSGWPINWPDLESYFSRSEKKLGLPSRSYNEENWPYGNSSPVKFDKEKLQSVYSQFSPQPNFARAFSSQLKNSMNVHVMFNANVTEILVEKNAKKVKALQVKSLSGKEGLIKARYYVLCCGAIDTARLLLASRSTIPEGLGNQQDLVGRYFLDHVHARSANVYPVDRNQFISIFAPYYSDGIKICPKVLSSPQLQEKEQITHIAGDIVFEPLEDSTIDAAKLIYKSIWRKDLRRQLPDSIIKVCNNPKDVVTAAFRYFVLKETISNKSGQISVGIQCEPEPNPLSRIRLSNQQDALGMPKAIIDWRLTGKEKRSIETFLKTLNEEFTRLHLAKVDLDSYRLPEQANRLDEKVFDSAHHMGTTRMHNDPKKGVVTTECRVHGIQNLYIGSASVFPTASFSNPTVNAIALCLRVSDRIKQRLSTPDTVDVQREELRKQA